MIKKTYESPEIEYFIIAFEDTLNGIQYSKNEDFHQSGEEGGNDDVPDD